MASHKPKLCLYCNKLIPHGHLRRHQLNVHNSDTTPLEEKGYQCQPISTYQEHLQIANSFNFQSYSMKLIENKLDNIGASINQGFQSLTNRLSTLSNSSTSQLSHSTTINFTELNFREEKIVKENERQLLKKLSNRLILEFKSKNYLNIYNSLKNQFHFFSLRELDQKMIDKILKEGINSKKRNTVYIWKEALKFYANVIYPENKFIFPKLKMEKVQNDFLEHGEVELLYKEAKEKNDLLAVVLFTVLYNTGLRINEAKELTYEFDDCNSQKYIVSKQHGCKKIKECCLTNQALYHIEKYREMTKSIETDKIIKITVQHCNRKIKEYMNIIGLTKNISNHSFRHAHLTRLEEHMKEKQLKQALSNYIGHSSTQVTEIYLHHHENKEDKVKLWNKIFFLKDHKENEKYIKESSPNKRKKLNPEDLKANKIKKEDDLTRNKEMIDGSIDKFLKPKKKE